jgi:para-nitrobenzyl esterase
MPPARGLFRRAILQSGAGRAATPETADRIAHAMLELLGISRGNEADLLTLAPDAILKAQGLIGSKLGAEARFNPVIDPAVLPATPIGAIAGGAAREIEIVIGTNRDEIKQFVAMTRREPIDDAQLLAEVRATLPKAGASEAQEAIDLYRASRKAHQLPYDNLDILDAVVTDTRFRIPSIRLAQGQIAAGGKAWMYLFTHESPARRGALGACHSVEMPFVFGTLDAPTQDRFAGTGPDVERLSGEMMDAWLGFSRNGAPDHASIAPWSLYDAQTRPTMIFGTKASTQQPNPFADERRLMERLV